MSRNVSDSNKRTSGDLLHGDEPSQRICRSQVSDFVFKRDCLFCGAILRAKVPTNIQLWVHVCQCETEKIPGHPTFKQVILDI